MKPIVLFLSITLVTFLVVSLIFSYFPVDKKVKLKVNRFEQELFSITNDNLIKKSNSWNTIFGSFTEVFATQIMNSSQLTTTQYYDELLAFTQHKDMREAYDSTAIVFDDFSEFEHSLELAFGQFTNEFPSYPLPEITTFFGGFNYGVVTYDNNIAIGLENFLGTNSKFYQFLGDPQYLRFQKQKKFILSNVMEVWYNEHFQKYLLGRDLLSQIIDKGKAMYFIDKMLVNISLEDKFRFTKSQIDWVIKNEASIWEFLVHEDMLFSKKEMEFRSFVNYAPFAKGMPQEAPGRVAYYIGYKIVNEYMNNNEIDIEELMYLTDSRKFLQESKYKPTK